MNKSLLKDFLCEEKCTLYCLWPGLFRVQFQFPAQQKAL